MKAYTPPISMVLTACLNNYVSEHVVLFSISNRLDYVVSDIVWLTSIYKHGLNYVSVAKS